MQNALERIKLEHNQKPQKESRDSQKNKNLKENQHNYRAEQPQIGLISFYV